MGQELNKISLGFPKTQWIESKKHHNNGWIYKNSEGLFAEKRELVQDKKLSSEQELKIYHERSSTILPLVQVYSCEIHEEKQNFCSVTQKLLLYVEYIPNRLETIKAYSLTEPECFYILQSSLKAFHELFNKFGYFEIKPDLIGFNTKGHIKCWLNKNFASNRIENSNNFMLTGYEYNQSHMIDNRLKETLEKAMVSDLWKIIKKKSNIENKDLFHRLSGLENTTFENALKLIELLITRYQFKLPSFLLFENCLEYQAQTHNDYGYSKVYDSENKKLKVVEIVENEVLRSGTFNFQPQENDSDLKDFESYRNHIDKINKKEENNCEVSLSFGFNLPTQQVKNTKRSEKVTNGLHSPRRMLKIVDKTFDINLCSQLKSLSIKTIPETEPSEKKIESEENILLPLNTLEKETSIMIPNVRSERIILNEISSNLPSNRTLIQKKEIRSPVKEDIILPNETNGAIFIQNYPPVLRRTISRFVPSQPPAQIFVQNESKTDKSSNKCKNPQNII